MPQDPTRTPELLAPAGGVEAFRAAISAGADAVYLGLGELNARRGAENFTIETLARACRLAHLNGRRVYLTANIVVLPDELTFALDTVSGAWAAGVDAVIVQDLGLLRAIRHSLPDVRVHVSTQVNTHSSDTLAALSSLGVSRVTLARETSLDEIGRLSETAHRLGVETESFVHGAICICYSGQCLFSSMVGGRSANRGLCAQPCRLPYELVDEAEQSLGDVGAHLLSPKDLAGISVLPTYVASGVDSLKIEGRMKSAEYVALVTGVYRAALDRALCEPGEFSVRDGELSVLSEAFSRGFTQAYLVGDRTNEMMSYRRPNNRGVPVGRVVASAAGRTTIALDTALDSGDSVEFWTSQGRFAQEAGPLEYGGAAQASAPAGERVVISTREPTSRGDRVFRVHNAALAAAAERLYVDTAGPAIALHFRVRVVKGEQLAVDVEDGQGVVGSAVGATVEPARTRAVSAEDIAEHVGRLGGTPYHASTWDIALSPGVGIGFSELHRVRREALASYEAAILEPWSTRAIVTPRLPDDHASAPKRTQMPALVAVVANMEAAQACLEAGADEVHLASSAMRPGVALPPGLVPVTPRVCHEDESDALLAATRSLKTGVAGTLGALWRLSSEGCDMQAHWSLNALNTQAVVLLEEMGARLVWLSPELSIAQVKTIAASAAAPVGVAIGGRQELMVTEHCVLMAEGPCAQRCESCARRRGTRLLRDRKGYLFPVVTDASGRTHLYNSVRLDASGALSEIVEAGVSALRLDLETESSDFAARETGRMRKAMQAAVAGQPVRKLDEKSTSGHYFRGVR